MTATAATIMTTMMIMGLSTRVMTMSITILMTTVTGMTNVRSAPAESLTTLTMTPKTRRKMRSKLGHTPGPVAPESR